MKLLLVILTSITAASVSYAGVKGTLVGKAAKAAAANKSVLPSIDDIRAAIAHRPQPGRIKLTVIRTFKELDLGVIHTKNGTIELGKGSDRKFGPVLTLKPSSVEDRQLILETVNSVPGLPDRISMSLDPSREYVQVAIRNNQEMRFATEEDVASMYKILINMVSEKSSAVKKSRKSSK